MQNHYLNHPQVEFLASNFVLKQIKSKNEDFLSNFSKKISSINMYTLIISGDQDAS
jgi:hypothetical protein